VKTAADTDRRDHSSAAGCTMLFAMLASSVGLEALRGDFPTEEGAGLNLHGFIDCLKKHLG
jgi:hypothetical protein